MICLLSLSQSVKSACDSNNCPGSALITFHRSLPSQTGGQTSSKPRQWSETTMCSVRSHCGRIDHLGGGVRLQPMVSVHNACLSHCTDPQVLVRAKNIVFCGSEEQWPWWWPWTKGMVKGQWGCPWSSVQSSYMSAVPCRSALVSDNVNATKYICTQYFCVIGLR